MLWSTVQGDLFPSPVASIIYLESLNSLWTIPAPLPLSDAESITVDVDINGNNVIAAVLSAGNLLQFSTATPSEFIQPGNFIYFVINAPDIDLLDLQVLDGNLLLLWGVCECAPQVMLKALLNICMCPCLPSLFTSFSLLVKAKTSILLLLLSATISSRTMAV